MRKLHKAKWIVIARLILSYLSSASSERRFARAGLIAIFIACFAQVQITVLLNRFHGDIFTALQNLNIRDFFYAFATLVAGNLIFICLLIGRTYFQQAFELRWRRWLTARYLERWTANAVSYRMQFQHEGRIDNPDQRIAEDVKNMISGTLGIAFGFFGSSVSLASFGAVLWSLSGSIEIPIWYDFKTQTMSFSITVQGYLVWIALFYESLATFIALKIGRPLTSLDNQQQRREADFRYGLVRLREEAESVAFLQGGSHEESFMINRFSEIYENGISLIIANARYTSFQYFSGQLTSYLPYLVAGPRYFTGAITLGQFVQINGALLSVTDSLAWLLGAFPSLASWRATVDRLIEFDEAMAACHEANFNLKTTRSGDGIILDSQLRLDRPDGDLLLSIAPWTKPHHSFLRFDENIMITGASGSGKSTFLRAIAGLWPFGYGVIVSPDPESSLFLPQKPYFPLGTSLREAIWYPRIPPATDDAISREAELLRGLGLSNLLSTLDQPVARDWCKSLSMGEQQRLSLARALLLKPRWLFLDEPFSAMDKFHQEIAAEILRSGLVETTLVCVSHTPVPSALNSWRRFDLRRQDGEEAAALVEMPLVVSCGPGQ